YHSIIGEVLGHGPAGTDGVVAYPSAHVDGGDSEVVVPADHLRVHHHPRAVLEVRRILEEHLRAVREAEPRPTAVRLAEGGAEGTERHAVVGERETAQEPAGGPWRPAHARGSSTP